MKTYFSWSRWILKLPYFDIHSCFVLSKTYLTFIKIKMNFCKNWVSRGLKPSSSRFCFQNLRDLCPITIKELTMPKVDSKNLLHLQQAVLGNKSGLQMWGFLLGETLNEQQ